ncbi:MAG: GatB/YqeY domain-containing protein, partial [Pedobacter sp.]
QLDQAEIEAIVAKIIAETGATSIKEMGKIMGIANKELAGKADGKLIGEIVKAKLG